MAPTWKHLTVRGTLWVAVKLGVITQADLGDQDNQNVSDAFVERVRKGMDALTVRGEMDKKLAKEQEKFRDFATHTTNILDHAGDTLAWCTTLG